MTNADSRIDSDNGAPERNGHATGQSGSGSVQVVIWLSEMARALDEGDENACETESGMLPMEVGPFRLESVIGRGSYGLVIRAFDTELERYVALKLAWPHVMFNAISSRRFVNEPKTVALLDHPGIVKVYRSGWMDSICYIAFELIEGPALSQWFSQQRHVSARIAAEIVRRIAESVHVAHEKGVIHRDLKPSNILLRPTAGSGELAYEPVVTDFGLARDSRVSRLTNATATRGIVGSDQYMSPEQTAGDIGKVREPTDIFALGVILFELLSGCRPFEADTVEQTHQLIKNEVPPSLRSLRKHVPRDLETIVAKCLEKSPNRRYASALELADDLRRFLNNEPIEAKRSRPWQICWKYAQRKPLVVSLWSLAAASTLTIAGLLGAWIADRISSANQLTAANSAMAVAEGIERQHQYASNIQHAAQSLSRTGRRDTLELLEQCRSLAREGIHCGIEWELLWAMTNGADRTLQAHRGAVHSVRMSPRGEVLVSAGDDGTVVLWDTATWTRRLEFNDDVGEVNVAEISADGSLLAVAGTDGRLVVHQMESGTILFDARIIDGRIFCGRWLGQENRFVVGGDGAILSIVDPIGRGSTRSLPLPASAESRRLDVNHPDEISAIEYIPESGTIAVVKAPPEIHLIDASTLTVTSSWEGESRASGVLCHIPVGPGYLATNLGDFSVLIWNLCDGSQVAELPVSQVISELRYSKSAGALGAALRNGDVQTWEIDAVLKNRPAGGRRFSAHSGRAKTVEFSPDGTWLASGGKDGCIRLWRSRSLRDSFDVTLDGKPCAIKFSPCERWLAVADKDLNHSVRVTVFDAKSGERLWDTGRTPLMESNVQMWEMRTPLTFDQTGDEIAVIDSDLVVRSRESRTGRILKPFPAVGDQSFWQFQYSPDNRFLVTHPRGCETSVFERTSGIVVDRISDQSRWPIGVFRTNRGDLWLETNTSRNCVLRPSISAPPLVDLGETSEVVKVATASHDGRYLAAGGTDRVVYLWNLDHGGQPIKFVGHEGIIKALCFSADDRTVLSHVMQGTLRFWDVVTRAELLKLGTPEEPILCFGINPAGNLLVLGVEHDGRYGLQIHRLGPKRDALPGKLEYSQPTGL